MPFERQSALPSRPALAVATPYYATAFFVFLGLYTFGCTDSGSVNPVVELASLTVTPGSLQPAFSAGITQYTVDLSDNITSVTINARPAVEGDTVTINGQATTSRVITLGAVGTTTPVSIVVSETDTNSRTYTVLLVRAGLTGNNSLQNLTISPGTLVPSFDPNIQAYTIDVANNVGSVTVTPTLSDPAGTMTVNGEVAGSGQPRTIPLISSSQTTNVPIVVTAQNGSTKTYFLTVSRGTSGNNSLRDLRVSPGALSPTFSAGILGYRVDVGGNVPSVTVTPTLQDPTARMTVNGQGTNSGEPRTIELNGASTNTFITIVVTAQNNSPRAYTVNVRRTALGGNNNLSSLTVSPGTLAPSFSASQLTYAVEVAEGTSSVTISATKSDPDAVMSGSVDAGAGTATGQATIPLDGPGTSQAVSVTVTAPNQGSKTYTVTIEWTAQAGNNNLQNLTVSPGTLAPSFSASLLTYAVEVAEGTSSVTISATKSDPNAVMSGAVDAEAGISTGQATIPLDGPGTSRAVSITVTAPNQNSKTYTITLERTAQAGNNNLQSLAVSPGDLAPRFSPNRTEYTVNVRGDVTSVTVIAVPQDPNTGMEVNGQGTAPGQARQISLGAEGSSTNISIRVNPPNGNAKTYTIVLNRASGGNDDSKKGNKNNPGNGKGDNNGSKRGDGDDD